MFHIFTEVENEVEKLKTALTGVFGKVTDHVNEAATWTEDELKAAEAEVLAKFGGKDFSISQIFEEGAKWAATKVTAAVTPVIEGAVSGAVSGVEAGVQEASAAKAEAPAPEAPAAGIVNQ